MTPAEIEAAARRKYNATNDTFWSSSDFYDYIYNACLELAREALCIERVYTTTSVAGQQEYDYPTQAISIKRITYDGAKLEPIDFREDDQLTLNNSATTDQGNSQYYSIWNETIYLRPIPSDAKTIKIFAYVEPQAITSGSTLEVPTLFHMGIVDFCLSEMASKDRNQQLESYYKQRWDAFVQKAKAWSKKKKRGDSFAAVKDEETMSTTLIGYV